MKIAIDLSAVGSQGTMTWTEGFLPAFLSAAASHDVLAFGSPETQELTGKAAPNIAWLGGRRMRTVPWRVMWEQTALPLHLLKWRADVLFAPFDLAPLLAPCPVVLAVRNPMPTALRHNIVPAQRASTGSIVHKGLTTASCRRARVVFYPTAFAASFLGDAMNVPFGKRRVIFHGTDTAFWSTLTTSQDFPVHGITPGRYLLFVSRLYPQKNPQLLLRAYAAWRQRHGDATWRVVFVGDHTSKEEEYSIKQLAQELGVESEARFLERVERRHLAALYQHAAAFVLPTVMETFGQPFVEAMAAGAPVIAADTAFARELCGDAALYFETLDPAALTSTIERVVSDSSLSMLLRDAGRARCRSFSWEREARETLALLEEVGRASIKPGRLRNQTEAI